VEPSELQCLFRSWGHSREEDGDGLTVYRPAGFAFPLSRGRDWIDFRPDGTMVHYDLGPDDRSRGIDGSWTDVGGRTLEIRKGPDVKSRRVTIVECDQSVLKVRWG
jgi:hypothetical protein